MFFLKFSSVTETLIYDRTYGFFFFGLDGNYLWLVLESGFRFLDVFLYDRLGARFLALLVLFWSRFADSILLVFNSNV